MRTYGELVRDFREKAGLTKSEVARRMNFSLPYILDIERGTRAPLGVSDTRTLAGILQCDESLLQSAASVTRGVLLQLGEGGPDKHKLLVELACKWEGMTEADCRRVLWALRGKTRAKK